MATPVSDEKFREIGEKAAAMREAAFKSYSAAADVVRERMKAVEEAIRVGGTQEAIDRRQGLLSNAQVLKDLTERTLDNADGNWREWREEARARETEAQLKRQEAIAESGARAAWAAAFTAIVTAVVGAGVAIWPIVAPLLRRP